MGGRAGGGAGSGRGGGAARATMADVKEAQKALTSAQSKLTKAKNEYAAAEGSVRWTAQGEKAKAEAKVRFEKAQQKYFKAFDEHKAAQAHYDKTVASFQGKVKKTKDTPLF